MEAKNLKHISKQLSLVLRHKPQLIGISLDSGGWVAVDVLIRQFNEHFGALSEADLTAVVEGNDKKRFAFSADGLRIRASQGHSVPVDLGYDPQTPPAVLFHGTVAVNIPPIMESGIQKGQRHHVHLSPTVETATQVARRKGAPVIIQVDAQRMHADGHVFFQSENGVWLTDWVPPAYLKML